MNQYVVFTQYGVEGYSTWFNAMERRLADTLEAAHAEGKAMIKEAREYTDGFVVDKRPTAPRRYVIAELLFTSEPC